MATSKTSIANQALAEVPHAPIQDIDENSKAAVEVRRVYDQCKGELLEACRWTFATRRHTLSVIANTRETAWGYAYSFPNNVAVVHRLIPSQVDVGGSYVPTYGQTLAPIMPLSGDYGDREQAFPYQIDESTIYTDLIGAVVEYTRSDVDEGVMPPMFVRALALEIASRIVVPLTGDASKKVQLATLAEMTKQRAMAADLNRQPRSINPIPEAFLVR